MDDCHCQDGGRICEVVRITDEAEVNRKLKRGDFDLLSVGNEAVKGGGQRPYYILGKVETEELAN